MTDSNARRFNAQVWLVMEEREAQANRQDTHSAIVESITEVEDAIFRRTVTEQYRQQHLRDRFHGAVLWRTS